MRFICALAIFMIHAWSARATCSAQAQDYQSGSPERSLGPQLKVEVLDHGIVFSQNGYAMCMNTDLVVGIETSKIETIAKMQWMAAVSGGSLSKLLRGRDMAITGDWYFCTNGEVKGRDHIATGAVFGPPGRQDLCKTFGNIRAKVLSGMQGALNRSEGPEKQHVASPVAPKQGYLSSAGKRMGELLSAVRWPRLPRRSH